jgi:hypothetical protein
MSFTVILKESYLGLEILDARAGGAYRVIAQRISAALACTSGDSYFKNAIRNKNKI